MKRTSRRPKCSSRAAPNPPVSIVVDRDLTNEAGGLVASFAEPLTIFRVMDGEELAIVHAAGKIEGGLFSTLAERRQGASWAASSMEDVARWGRSWQPRLGKDLFVAAADGRGRVFYHETAHRVVPFDPSGSAQQAAQLDSELCNTGLGCSMTIDTKDVSFFSVDPSGELEPMTERQIRSYLDEHPVPDVMLRSMGSQEWFSGLILGTSVAVGQDHHDKLWSVQDRAGRRFVIGAKTKKAAVDEALQAIEMGNEWRVTRLNRVPDGFDDVKVGQAWAESRGGRAIKITHVGASYVNGFGKTHWDDKVQMTVPATELMKKWRMVRDMAAGRDAVRT